MPDPRFAAGAAYVKDKFVPIAEAVIPVTDWGFTRSDVVSDVVYDVVPKDARATP